MCGATAAPFGLVRACARVSGDFPQSVSERSGTSLFGCFECDCLGGEAEERVRGEREILIVEMRVTGSSLRVDFRKP